MPTCHSEDVKIFLDHLGEFDSVFYKSLARNDHQWANGPKGHQSGVLIPRGYAAFFGLKETPTANTSLKVNIEWILGGELFSRKDMQNTAGYDVTTLRYYCGGNRKNRPEVHLTNVYNPYFEDLEDGALLIIGRISAGDDYRFLALILDVESEDLITEIEHAIELPPGLSWGVVPLQSGDETRELSQAELSDKLAEIIGATAINLYQNSELPTTEATSRAVWKIAREHPELLRHSFKCPGITNSKSPFYTAQKNAPGNLTRWLLNQVEFHLIIQMEQLHYPAILVNHLRRNAGDANELSWDFIKTQISSSLSDIIGVSKSLTQARRSRAGYSFEWHISELLNNYGINHRRQAGDDLLDFEFTTRSGEIVALSAKTTTRERWKQVRSGAYFITLDRKISSAKLQNIASRGIRIVVPEEDLSDIEHYRNSDTVISFKDFFTKYGSLKKF